MIKYIKNVKKYVEISEDHGVTFNNTGYHTKLFPLSFQEINGNQDTSYTYYKGVSDAKRIKSNSYWLRSPFPEPNTNNRAYFVTDKGAVSNKFVFSNACVVPAFCI